MLTVGLQAGRVLLQRHSYNTATPQTGWLSQGQAAALARSSWNCSTRCCKLPLQTVSGSWELHNLLTAQQPLQYGLACTPHGVGPMGH